MNKPNLKLNLDINFFNKKNKGTLWQKGILGVNLLLALFIVLSCSYLFIKPISSEIKNIIDDEISSVDIIFDQKTIDSIEARQEPSSTKDTSVGKNPFAGF
jgi:hypothetical protein